MLKKFLISFVLFGFCFIDTKNGFAITAEDSLNKNNTQNIKQTEPHFDLPKKDAKEQCDEVERVVRECYKVSNRVFDKPYKCGNVNVRIIILGDPFFEKIGDNIMVLNQSLKPIGIDENYKNAIMFGDYENNFTVLPENSSRIPEEYTEAFIKYKNKISLSKIKYRINNCYIKNIN